MLYGELPIPLAIAQMETTLFLAVMMELYRYGTSELNPVGDSFKAHSGIVYEIAISPDGQNIISAGEDGLLKRWDFQGNPIGEPFRGHDGEVTAVKFSPDENVILSTGSDKTIRLWDKPGATTAFSEFESGEIWDLDYSPDGKLIVSANDFGTLQLWNNDGILIGLPFGKSRHGWLAATFSPNEK